MLLVLLALLSADPSSGLGRSIGMGEYPPLPPGSLLPDDPALVQSTVEEAGLRDLIRRREHDLFSSAEIERIRPALEAEVLSKAATFLIEPPTVIPDAITVRRQVDVDALSAAFQALAKVVADTPKPAMLVLVTQPDFKPADKATCANDFDEALLGALGPGWHTVDGCRVSPPKGGLWSVHDARALAAKIKARIALVGNITAAALGPSALANGMTAASANLNLRVVDLRSGEVLQTISARYGDVSTLSVDAGDACRKAVRIAGKQAAQILSQRLLFGLGGGGSKAEHPKAAASSAGVPFEVQIELIDLGVAGNPSLATVTPLVVQAAVPALIQKALETVAPTELPNLQVLVDEQLKPRAAEFVLGEAKTFVTQVVVSGEVDREKLRAVLQPLIGDDP